MKNIKNYDLPVRLEIILALWVFIFIALTAGAGFAADKYPASRGTAVNDFAGVIDPDSAAKIESLSREVLQKTGTAIVVVTMP
ncbi:MAG: hypothetical protein PHH96_07870, partial [Smithellaceae bacterium]|nr:hypothetical protein [Smithellaceae bacterium]